MIIMKNLGRIRRVLRAVEPGGPIAVLNRGDEMGLFEKEHWCRDLRGEQRRHVTLGGGGGAQGRGEESKAESESQSVAWGSSGIGRRPVWLGWT